MSNSLRRRARRKVLEDDRKECTRQGMTYEKWVLRLKGGGGNLQEVIDLASSDESMEEDPEVMSMHELLRAYAQREEATAAGAQQNAAVDALGQLPPQRTPVVQHGRTPGYEAAVARLPPFEDEAAGAIPPERAVLARSRSRSPTREPAVPARGRGGSPPNQELLIQQDLQEERDMLARLEIVRRRQTEAA